MTNLIINLCRKSLSFFVLRFLSFLSFSTTRKTKKSTSIKSFSRKTKNYDVAHQNFIYTAVQCHKIKEQNYDLIFTKFENLKIRRHNSLEILKESLQLENSLFQKTEI